MKPGASIRRKVTLALAATCVLALATVASSVWIFEHRATELRARATLESLTQTLAPSLVASLDFDAADVAAESLRRLEAGGFVAAATVFRANGDTPAQYPVFAHYQRPGITPVFPSTPVAPGYQRRGDRALLAEIVRSDGHPVALLQLEADIGPFRRSLDESLAILLLVLGVLGTAALLLSRLLQRTLTRPLLELAATVEHVRKRTDFSARARVSTRDEVGRLAEGFNLMLAGIEQRDRQLAEQAAFQQAVLENAGVSIISTDTSGVIRTFNATAEHMLGYRREEVVGQRTPGFIHDPHELDRRAARLSHSLGRTIPPDFTLFAELARHVPSALEWTYVRKDGTRLPVFLVISALRATDGSPLGFCVIATDLTERKAAEEAVHASQERLRLSLEASPVGVSLIEHSGRILSLNRKFVEWFGYTQEELPTVEAWWPLAYPDPEYRQQIQQIWTERMAAAGQHSGEMQPTEALVACRDGRRRLIEFRAQLFDGMALITFTDITARREAEAAVRTSEERYRIVAEQTGQLIFDQDIRTGNRAWAGAALAMIGFSLEEIAGSPDHWWSERVHPEERDEFRLRFRRVLTEGGTDRYVYRFLHRDGRWIYLAGVVTTICDAAGQPTRLLCNIADVTRQQEDAESIRRLNAELEQRVQDRTAELARRIAEVEQLNHDLCTSQDDLAQAASRLQEANANLLAANQELESFSYSVSHDLRAPLRNIAGFIELLRKRTTGQLDAEADRYFGIVGSEAIRMGSLIDDLLTFSRIGRAELHFTPVQLATLVAETQGELQSELAGRPVEWRIQPMPPVLGDRTLLRQVMANLLGNATKFTRHRQPAVIEIGVQPATTEAEFLTFFVRDNGAGFDPRYTHKLFGVFQRLHNPREFEGTGIGLANVKRIVNRHGGRVWAEGLLDKGATFYFTLRPAKP